MSAEYMRKWRSENHERSLEINRRSYRNNRPTHAFHSQRRRAKERGIEWDMTREEWLEFWGEDIDKRGTSPDSLVMSRYNDEGPYKIGNVEKKTMSENGREGALRQQGVL